MSKYLLTYEDAQEIAKKYHNNNFWESQHMLNGFKVATFNYFICGWNDFENPLPNKPHVNAFDMRGVTFTFDKKGKQVGRFFMLPKFFNINQVEATLYHNVKDKKIEAISVKEDGSLVGFMNLPDGKLFAKTIGSFVSDQSQAAYGILYTYEEHVIWVKELLKMGYTPLFEYVSWDNRIVLKYGDAHLRFIGVRDNMIGDFISAGECESISELADIPDGIYRIPEETGTLDELLERAKIEQDKEGWVIKYPGMLMKVKTAWYFKLHGLRTENVFREDYVISNYLGETLDDLMTQLNPKEDNDAFEFVKTVTGAINNYIAYIDKCTSKLKLIYEKEYDDKWHYFAKFYNKEPYFGLARTLIDRPEEYNFRKVEMILKKTYRLKTAKQIVDKWKTKEPK